jgi:hypothetical protein
MRRRRAILAGAVTLLVVLVAGIGLWFATMPYPFEVWRKAWFDVRYSDEWPVSESDFASAMRLVKNHLGWREIITRVTVTGPDEIEITTLARRSHACGESSCRFIVRRVNGKWEIAKVRVIATKSWLF